LKLFFATSHVLFFLSFLLLSLYSFLLLSSLSLSIIFFAPLRSVAPLVASLVVATALVATPGLFIGGTTSPFVLSPALGTVILLLCLATPAAALGLVPLVSVVPSIAVVPVVAGPVVPVSVTTITAIAKAFASVAIVHAFSLPIIAARFSRFSRLAPGRAFPLLPVFSIVPPTSVISVVLLGNRLPGLLHDTLHLPLELLFPLLSFIGSALQLFYLPPLFFGLSIHHFFHVLNLP